MEPTAIAQAAWPHACFAGMPATTAAVQANWSKRIRISCRCTTLLSHCAAEETGSDVPAASEADKHTT
jgi:hypothetical protein